MCALVLGGCSSAPKTPASVASGSNSSLEDLRRSAQREYERYLLPRTPEKEYKKNLQDGSVCFYCWGSVANGYHYPGLTHEQVDRLVIGEKMEVRVYWRDDPVSLVAGSEPFDSMVAFIQSYNLYVLDHLKGRHNQTSTANDLHTD